MTPASLFHALQRQPRWVKLLLVAIVARLLTFGNPVVHVDESFYFTTARAMLGGALPYVDIWDRKPIGLFLLYVPAAAFGVPLGVWVYQAMALAAVVATATFVARFADRCGWRRGAMTGAVAYILWLDLLGGAGGQAPVFYNLLMVAAAGLIAPDERNPDARTRLTRGLAAMALVGVALQIKYSVVFEGCFFGLWWMWREWRLSRSVPHVLPGGAALAAVALLPTVAAWGYYAVIGQSGAFLYANFLSIAARQPDPMREQLLNLAQIVLITSPLYAAAILAWRREKAAGVPGWLFAWLIAATLGLLAFGSWFDHYALPVLVPLTIAAAGFVDDPRRSPKIAYWVLGLAFVGAQATTAINLHNRGTSAQFDGVAATIGTGPGCLYVFSGDSMMYAYSGRCRLSRYVFPSHLGRVRERGAIGVDQQAEIERILALRPEVVAVRGNYPGERAELRALVLQRMARDYRLRGSPPLGNGKILVFERR
ncbi:MAG: hypothetical protein V4459_04775 [Pseudomonadota bacterium]